MNSLIAKMRGRRNGRFPQWLREEWVWEGVLVVLVMPVIVHAVLSLGVAPVV